MVAFVDIVGKSFTVQIVLLANISLVFREIVDGS